MLDGLETYGVDKVLDAVVASYVCGYGSTTMILMSIRKDTIKELFESLPDLSKMEEAEQKNYKKMRNEFIQEISQTA